MLFVPRTRVRAGGDDDHELRAGARGVSGEVERVEHGVTDEISVGGSASFLSHTYFGNDKFTAIYIGGRGSYHVNKLLQLNNDKLDLYAGAALGYRSFKWSNDYFGGSLGGSYGSGIYFGGFIGGRYYFANNIGAFLELGAGGSSNANLGVAFKF